MHFSSVTENNEIWCFSVTVPLHISCHFVAAVVSASSGFYCEAVTGNALCLQNKPKKCIRSRLEF